MFTGTLGTGPRGHCGCTLTYFKVLGYIILGSMISEWSDDGIEYRV